MNLEFSGEMWKTSLFPKDGRYIVPVKALSPERRRA